MGMVLTPKKAGQEMKTLEKRLGPESRNAEAYI